MASTPEIEKKATHTAGPWRAETAASSSGFGRVIVAPREDVPDVFVAYVGNWKQGPERENADAALIAAAPELLAFVKKAASFNPVFAKGAEKQVIAEAQRLVAKAEG